MGSTFADNFFYEKLKKGVLGRFYFINFKALLARTNKRDNLTEE